MKIVFDPENHSYKTEDNIEFTSVTKVLSKYKQPFNQQEVARKACKNKRSKWYGLTPEQAIAVWNKEADRSVTLGNWYHDQREKDLLACKSLTEREVELPIYGCTYNEQGYKIGTDQKLSDGVYPEYFLYLQSMGIAGQSDRITVSNGRVDILDYKTNKEIKISGYKNYEGISQKMLFPLNHLTHN